jgi:hypothetical protein
VLLIVVVELQQIKVTVHDHVFVEEQSASSGALGNEPGQSWRGIPSVAFGGVQGGGCKQEAFLAA